MTHRHRIRYPRAGAVLAFALFLVAAPATPAGFQVMTQGARAMGMGLAWTAVTDDPTAIFYNPAGLGWMSHYEGTLGGALLTRTSSEFQGANPYPGTDTTEHYQNQSFLLPQAYGVVPLTKELNFGLGSFAPYGLGLRWKNPEVFTGAAGTSPVSGTSFSGRFISQNAVVKTIDTNAVFSYRLLPELSIAAGAVYRFSKVQLERNQAAINPFTNAFVDVTHIKLNSDLLDNHGWGWNAALMFKPVEMLSIGASYRSKITITYDATGKFTQRPTGNAAFDAAVNASLVAQGILAHAGDTSGTHAATATLEFPATANMGAAVILLDKRLTVSFDADWTKWTSFKSLDITFPDLPTVSIHRQDLWHDSWAFRGGVEYKVTKNWAVRGGYYYDQTPQPVIDAGPILADNNRDAFTLGFGYNTEKWGVDIGDVYLKVRKLDTTGGNTDHFFGTFKETANIFAINFRLAL